MIVSDRQGSMMGLSNAHVQGIGLETTGARRPAGLDPKGTYGRGHGALAPRMLLGRAKVSSLLGLRTADRPASKLVLERDRDCRLTSDRNLDARLVAPEPQIHSSMKPGDIALACCPPALWALCYVFAKPAIAHFPPLFMIGLAYAVSALVLLRLALRSKTRWWAMFTIAAFGGAIQSSLIVSGLQRLPASTAILVVQSQVPSAMLCAWAICGERPGVRQLSGIGIVLVGIVLIAGAPEAVDALGALSAFESRPRLNLDCLAVPDKKHRIRRPTRGDPLDRLCEEHVWSEVLLANAEHFSEDDDRNGRSNTSDQLGPMLTLQSMNALRQGT